MATSNFAIALPTAQDAYAVTPSAAVADDQRYGYQHLLNGPRYTIYKLNSASTTHSIVFDFGDQGYSADYLAIAKVNLITNPTSVAIAYSDDGTSYTTAATMSINTSSDYRGRFNQDQWKSFTEVTDKRYWRLTYTTSSASLMIHSKAYFGQLFDFGDEPNLFQIETIDSSDSFISNDGTRHVRKSADMMEKYSIEFKGVTDAVAQSFKEKVANKISPRAFGCGAFLITQTDHQLLHNREIMHVNITSYDFAKIHENYNLVRLECEEMQ